MGSPGFCGAGAVRVRRAWQVTLTSGAGTVVKLNVGVRASCAEESIMTTTARDSALSLADCRRLLRSVSVGRMVFTENALPRYGR